LLVTEWNEFKQLDWERVRQYMNQPIVIDGRNLYDPSEMQERGFTYWGVGRSTQPVEPSPVQALGNGVMQDTTR
jgi:UDPglucose 6-dehydrogenase